MVLNKNNIQAWKKELDEKSQDIFGRNYSQCLSDDEWLEGYEDMTPEEAIREDASYCI